MKRLVMDCMAFPWGTWEPFLATELRYLSLEFDRIDIISLSVRESQRAAQRSLPDNVHAHPIAQRGASSYLSTILPTMASRDYRSDVARMVRERRFSLRNLVRTTGLTARAVAEAREATDIVRGLGITPEDDVLFYAYRLALQTWILDRVRRSTCPGAPLISRAHGSDYIQEAVAGGFVPFRDVSVGLTGEVFFTSQFGRDYMAHHYPGAAARFKVARLGTDDHGVAQWQPSDGPLRIVSVSAIVPVKRLALLIEALGSVTQPVEWHHFGEGAQEEEMRALAQATLPDHVSVVWEGHIDNTDLVDRLVDDAYDAFISCSSSEGGFPVSMQEALSTGTPVIATAAGGIPEGIDATDGVILPRTAGAREIAAAIDGFSALPESEARRLREGARARWEQMSSADSTYPPFAAHLAALADGRDRL